MNKWWMSAVVVAGWLGLANPVSAQYLPEGQPPAPLSDPVPSAKTLSESAVPGPLNGYLAPYGPSEKLSLPANHSSAFPTEPRLEPEYYFVHAGTVALKRQHTGRAVTAFTDRTNTSRLDSGRLTSVTGLNPVMDLNDIDPPLSWGVTGTLGYMYGTYSFELSGMWIPETTAGVEVTDIGRLNTFFINSPLGFEGNNNMFRQADLIREELTTRIGGGEFNIRYFSQAYSSIEVLCGFRYLEYMERLSLLVDDDGATFLNILGQPSPLRRATYTSRTLNRLFGPQLGLECQKCLLPGLAFGAYAKATAAVNISDADQMIERGDGLVGFRDSRSDTTFACVLDLGVYADLYILERFRVRTGYQAIGLIEILEAPDQLNFDLNQVGGRRDLTGEVFLQGITIQFQFLF